MDSQTPQQKIDFQNLTIKKNLRDLCLFQDLEEPNRVKFFQKLENSLPLKRIKEYFEAKKYNNCEGLLKKCDIFYTPSCSYIRYEDLDPEWKLLKDYIDEKTTNSVYNLSQEIKVNIIKKLLNSYKACNTVVELLMINHDKILINESTLDIKFIETGIFPYLCGTGDYNYDIYDYFNYHLPYQYPSEFNSKKNNLYSLSCVIYYILSGEIPCKILVDRLSNQNMYLNQTKFNFQAKGIVDNRIFNILSTMHFNTDNEILNDIFKSALR